MSILLNDFIEIETTPYDLEQALTTQRGTSFCLDFCRLNIDEDAFDYAMYLVPLEVGFECKRTLIYNNGERIGITSKFGLYDYDFLDIGVPQVKIESKYNEYGVIISKNNPYYDIYNKFAKQFRYVDMDNKESFVLTNSELMEFALIPFELHPRVNVVTGEDGFDVKGFGDKISLDEYGEMLEDMIIDNSWL